MESKYPMNGSITHQRRASDLMGMGTPWALMDMWGTMLSGMLKSGTMGLT